MSNRMISTRKVIEQLHHNLEISPRLHNLAMDFSQAPLDWNRIIELYGEYVIFGKEGRTCEENLVGTIGELHVRSFLESVKAKDPAIDMLPIPYGTAKCGFVFNEGRLGNYEVVDTWSGRKFAEYDLITTFENLPVIWEIKMRDHAHGAYALPRIDQLLFPIHQYFQAPAYSYVVVLPKEHTFSEETAFSLKNILTLNMSLDLAQFRQEIELHKNQLKWTAFV